MTSFNIYTFIDSQIASYSLTLHNFIKSQMLPHTYTVLPQVLQCNIYSLPLFDGNEIWCSWYPPSFPFRHRYKLVVVITYATICILLQTLYMVDDIDIIQSRYIHSSPFLVHKRKNQLYTYHVKNVMFPRQKHGS